jgi:adenosylmethionine-8-amino-7-oxononanoate aminotransferase
MSVPTFLHPYARPAADRTSYLSIVRGEGACVFDDTGRAYVDATASLWFCQIGHGRAEMAEAVGDQLRTLDAFHCFDRFTNPAADELADALAAIAPMPDARVMLTSSGSEAVDTAIKLARMTSTRRGDHGRNLVVGRRHAYHGVTYGGLSVMGLPANQEGWGPLLGDVHAIDHDSLAGAEALFEERGHQIAAVIAEPVIGAGGVRPPEPGYLEGLRRLCDDHGALLVLDEVICGFGRLGGWWGAEVYGVEPDLVTFAKGVTSGYQPVGGVLVGRRVREALEADADFVLRTGHTYSGHPAGCRAALTNIAVLRDEGLLARALAIGVRIEPRLRALADAGSVAEVRGVAGIWAVDLLAGMDAGRVRDAMMARGVIARPLGTTTIALCPPLVITDAELDLTLDALADSITEVAAAV